MLSWKYKKVVRDVIKWSDVPYLWPVDVKEIIGHSFLIDDCNNLSFNFKSHTFSRKYLAAELLWYMSGNRSNENIGRYSRIWKEISTDKWFVNSNYWYIVFYKYIEDYKNQYNFVIQKLKEDEYSREAIIRYNSHEHAHKGNKDFVCMLTNQFFMRDWKLHMIVNTRITDIFSHFKYDLVRLWLLYQSIHLELSRFYPDIQHGNMYYNSGSIYLYDVDSAKRMLRQKWKNYSFILRKPLMKVKNKITANTWKLREELDNTKNYMKFIEENFNISIYEIK